MSDIHEQLRAKLSDASLPLPARFRALFSLRGLGNDLAVEALISGFNDPSALIRHEIAFCLGQMQNETAVSFLTKVLTNLEEHPMVRHEAAEALGAIAADGCEVPLMKHKDDEQQEVRETCRLAIRRLANQTAERKAEALKKAENPPEHSDDENDCDDASGVILVGSSRGGDDLSDMMSVLPGSAKEQMALAALKEYGGNQDGTPLVMSGCESADTLFLSVDPAPAGKNDQSSATLRQILLQEDGDMFERYSALFTLRNRGSDEEVEALTATFQCSSALLKHEVAYVLGQLQKEAAVDTLARVLDDINENPMVRHEAAEALGSIAIPRCTELLEKHLNDPEPIVAESCLVALDILEYENSGNLHYADMNGSNPVLDGSSYGSLEAQSISAH